MSDAQWTPIFVTASVPTEVVNSVFEKATKETYQNEDGDGDELVGNIWVLIQHPDQPIVSKPTNPPVAAFKTGFSDMSVVQLQDFVKTKLGETGLGHGSDNVFDHLADDAFAVIDERTAKDNTILFFAQELVDPIQEASVRVAWKNGTEHDEALVRYADGDSSEKDVTLLAGIKDGEDVESAKTRLKEWFDEEREKEAPRWFGFRLNIKTAVQDIYGINERGAFDMILDRDGSFDESGVMIC